MPDFRSLGLGMAGHYMPVDDISTYELVCQLTGTVIATETLTGTARVEETLTATIRCLNP